MTNKTVLSDEVKRGILAEWEITPFPDPEKLIDAVEQAVLQSPEIQQLSKDAEAFRSIVENRFRVVYHPVLGQALVWKGGHEIQENVEKNGHCKYETMRKAVKRAAMEVKP